MGNQQGYGLSSSKWILLGWHPQDCVHSVPSSSPELEEFPQGRGEIFHLQPLQSISDTAVCVPVGLGYISLPRTAQPLLSLQCRTHRTLPTALQQTEERGREKLPTPTNPPGTPCSASHTKDIPQALLGESEKENAWEDPVNGLQESKKGTQLFK